MRQRNSNQKREDWNLLSTDAAEFDFEWKQVETDAL